MNCQNGGLHVNTANLVGVEVLKIDRIDRTHRNPRQQECPFSELKLTLWNRHLGDDVHHNWSQLWGLTPLTTVLPTKCSFLEHCAQTLLLSEPFQLVNSVNRRRLSDYPIIRLSDFLKIDRIDMIDSVNDWCGRKLSRKKTTVNSVKNVNPAQE
jgi:hypothetical protein